MHFLIINISADLHSRNYLNTNVISKIDRFLYAADIIMISNADNGYTVFLR